MSQFESCTQPKCYLQEDGVDSDDLAEIIARVLAGENVTMRSPIDRLERCVDCVQNVLQGGKPLRTTEEVENLIEAGKWSGRRNRRSKRRESH